MNIFKTKNCTVSVHWAGLVLLGWATLCGRVLDAALAVLALLMHEGFHLLAIWLLKAKIERVELTPFGGVADVDSFSHLPAGAQFCIAASGTLGSLCCFAALGWVQNAPEWIVAFRVQHLMLGLLNLLPVLPLDGARMMGALLLKTRFSGYVARCQMLAGIVTGMLLSSLALYGASQGVINVSLLFVGPYLCYAARKAYMTSRMQLVEERLNFRAKWKKQKTMPVDGMACRSDMAAHEQIRLLLSLPPNRAHYFFCVDADTGKVVRTLQEAEWIDALLGQEEKSEKESGG